MNLTAIAGQPVDETNLTTIVVGKGITFDIDYKTMVALDTVEISFTGLVYHTFPIQAEIDRILGKYKPA